MTFRTFVWVKTLNTEFHLAYLKWSWHCLFEPEVPEIFLEVKSHNSQKEWRFKSSLAGALHSIFFFLTCGLLSYFGGNVLDWKERKLHQILARFQEASIQSSLSGSRLWLSWLLLSSVVAFVCHFVNKMVHHRIHLS